MQVECNICRNSYNLIDKYPVKICQKDHKCCNQCFDQIFNPKKDGACPFCRQVVKSYNFSGMKQDALEQFNITKAKHIIQTLQQQMRDLAQRSTRKHLKAYIWQKYKEIQQQYDIRTAINFLRRLIELDPNVEKDKFIGLGIYYQHIGFSEKQGYDWYENCYNLEELSLYDQLSVVLHIHKLSQQSDWQWVQKLRRQNPSNYKLIFLQAIIDQYSGLNFDEYRTFYGMIKINPDFDKPYEILAFMHLFDDNFRIAKQFASECLKRNPQNFFAEYILAVSDKDLSSFQIIKRLQAIIDKEPAYTRARYSYGKQLVKICRFEEAIQSFDLCLQINPHFLCPLIDKAIALFKHSERQAGIKLVRQLLNEQKYQYLWASNYLGTAIQSIGNIKKATQFHEKVCYSLSQAQRCIIGEFYLSIENWTMANKYYTWDSRKISNTDVIQKIARCYNYLNDHQNEIQWLHKLHLIKGSHTSVCHKLAASYESLNCLDAAIYWKRKQMEKAKAKYKQLTHLKIIELLYLNDQCTQSLQQAEKHRSKFQLQAEEKESLLCQDKKNYIKLKELKKAKGLAKI